MLRSRGIPEMLVGVAWRFSAFIEITTMAAIAFGSLWLLVKIFDTWP